MAAWNLHLATTLRSADNAIRKQHATRHGESAAPATQNDHSLLGCGGWAVFAGRCVYVRNRPQPFATVRNCSQSFARGRYGRAYDGKFCRRGHFWKFSASLGFVSRDRRGTLWRFNIFHDVSRVVLPPGLQLPFYWGYPPCSVHCSNPTLDRTVANPKLMKL